MSIVSNVNILIPTASVSGVAYSLYYLKETLKSASWSVLTSSDGTTLTGYADGTTGADSITSINVMNSASAWFRITDPDSNREFVFMRGSTATTAVIKYSRQSKFSTGGTANNLPTTGGGDGVVLLGSQLTDNAAISGSHGSTFMNAVAASARLHVIADNSKYIGSTIEKTAYPWYIFSTQVSTNTILNLYSHEGVDKTSYSSGDNDPSWFIVAPSATDLSYIDGTSQTYTAPTATNGISSGLTTASGRAWYKYGSSNAAFERAIGLIYTGINGASTLLPTYPNTTSTTVNPYDSKDTGIPFLVCSVNFPKGMSTGLKWKGVNRSFPDLTTYLNTYFDYDIPVDTIDCYVYLDKLLVPWPMSGPGLFATPIIPNTSSIG